MRYLTRRNAEGLKEVVWNRAEHPDLTTEEFCELVIREFTGMPMAPALFVFESESQNPDLMTMSLNWDALTVYPTEPPEGTLRLWATC